MFFFSLTFSLLCIVIPLSFLEWNLQYLETIVIFHACVLAFFVIIFSRHFVISSLYLTHILQNAHILNSEFFSTLCTRYSRCDRYICQENFLLQRRSGIVSNF
jgi:hypothetical protein